jgi:hypothetical protein
METNIAASLNRIEQKLDAILERLKWAPESAAEWFKLQHAAEQPCEPELFKK